MSLVIYLYCIVRVLVNSVIQVCVCVCVCVRVRVRLHLRVCVCVRMRVYMSLRINHVEDQLSFLPFKTVSLVLIFRLTLNEHSTMKEWRLQKLQHMT